MCSFLIVLLHIFMCVCEVFFFVVVTLGYQINCKLLKLDVI